MATMVITAALFPLLCFSIAAVLNTIAIGYHSLAAVPFGTIVVLLLIWLLLSVPLTLLGTVSLSSETAPQGCAGCCACACMVKQQVRADAVRLLHVSKASAERQRAGCWGSHCHDLSAHVGIGV